MDSKTAQAMGVEPQLIVDEPNVLKDAVQVAEMGLGEDGTKGVYLPGAKTYEQERQEVKEENEKIRQHLQNGVKLTDKKYLPRAGVKLSKVAPRVFAVVRANPPEWLEEFDQFISNTIGKCPSHTVRAQAANEWDAAVMLALLSWGYFAEMMNDELEHEPTDTGATDPVADAGVAGAEPSGGDSGSTAGYPACAAVDSDDDVEPLAPAEVEEPVPNFAATTGRMSVKQEHRPGARGVIVSPNTGAVGDTFAILGPDGETLIEKRR